MYYMPDPKNLDPSPFDLGFVALQNLTENEILVSAYKDYIRKSAELFCGQNCQLLEDDINDIVNFESELAKNQMPIELQRDPETRYNVFTLAQLKEKIRFDWLNLVVVPIWKSLSIPDQLSELDTILVSDVNYTIKAVDLLAKTPPRTVANYIGWRIVAHFGPHSSEQFRQFEFEFNQVRLGVARLDERGEKCYNLVYSQLNNALSRLFVDNYFSENEKKQASELINSIQHSYDELIEQNQWLDPETKKASLNKLNHVTKNVGYPEWILQNDQLDEYFNLNNQIQVEDLMKNDNYLISQSKFTLLTLKKFILDFRKPINIDKSWPFPPAIVNAAYQPIQNSITIPAGFLKPPFFNVDRPFSLNYGSVGMVIAHEFTHGLDDQGRQFDEVGNMNNWWTPEALERFRNRSECFVQQYGSQVEKVTGLNLNGKNTIGENIADNGGLRQSYHAFQARQSKSGSSPILADLPKLTSEQLYFISYAHTWCGVLRPELMVIQVLYDPHAPPEHRVNTPLSNSPEFASAFKCPVGSPMNPVNKCLLW